VGVPLGLLVTVLGFLFIRERRERRGGEKGVELQQVPEYESPKEESKMVNWSYPQEVAPHEVTAERENEVEGNAISELPDYRPVNGRTYG